VLLIKQICFSITCGGNINLVIVGNVGVVVASIYGCFFMAISNTFGHLVVGFVSVVDGGLEIDLPIVVGTLSLPTDVAIVDEDEDDAKPNTNGNFPKDTLKPHGKSTLFSLIWRFSKLGKTSFNSTTHPN